jgi:hypothetical protein
MLLRKEVARHSGHCTVGAFGSGGGGEGGKEMEVSQNAAAGLMGPMCGIENFSVSFASHSATNITSYSC